MAFREESRTYLRPSVARAWNPLPCVVTALRTAGLVVQLVPLFVAAFLAPLVKGA